MPRALGNLQEAEAAYRESLEISRTLRDRVGDTPEILRDLSVSLNKVGDTALRSATLRRLRPPIGKAWDLFARSASAWGTPRRRCATSPSP